MSSLIQRNSTSYEYENLILSKLFEGRCDYALRLRVDFRQVDFIFDQIDMGIIPPLYVARK